MASDQTSPSSPAHQATWATTWAYLGVAFGALNFIILFPRILSIEEVGMVRLIAAGGLIFVKFGFFGLDSSAVRYLSDLNPSEEGYKSHWRLLFLLTLMGMTAVCLIFLPITQHYLGTSAGEVLSPKVGLILFFTLCIAMLWQRFGESIARVSGRTAQSAFWRDMAPRLAMMSGVIGISSTLWGFGGFLTLWVSSYLIGTVCLNTTTLRQGLHANPLGSLPNSKQAVDVFKFSAYGFMGNAAAVIQTTLDSVMLSALSTLAELGLYAPFAYAAATIDIPTRALTAVCYPIFQRYIKNDEYDKASKLFSDVSFIQITIGGCILIGLWINLPLLLELLGTADYQGGGPVLFILGISLWLTATLGQASSILLCTKHYRLYSAISIAALFIGVGLNFVFIPKLGATGAAIATGITLLLTEISKTVLLWRKYNISPLSKRALKVAAIIATCLCLTSLIPQATDYVIVRSVLQSLATFAAILLIAWKLGLVSDFWQSVKRLKEIKTNT